MQILVEQKRGDVLDVYGQANVSAEQVSSLACAGQGRSVDLMPRLLQVTPDPLPVPPASERTMNQHKCRHPVVSDRKEVSTGYRNRARQPLSNDADWTEGWRLAQDAGGDGGG